MYRAENSISKSSSLRVNDMYVVARAVRNNNKVHHRQGQVMSPNAAPSLQMSVQNNPRFQTHESIKNAKDFSRPQQPKSQLPLVMTVSKVATRRQLQERPANSSDKVDSSTIRKQLVAPTWREKEIHRKRLQSAYFHNRRKIEEIQRMKMKLKCPQYDPNDLITPHRQQFVSESQSTPIINDSRQKENFPQSYDGSQSLSQSKSLMTISEDPLLEDVSGDNTSFEQILQEKESFVFNPTPSKPAKKPFLWNPVIFPDEHVFPSAIELVESNSSPQFELSNRREYDSPGNCTTSSTSSGLTVAEEILQLTYYAERCKVPLDNQSHLRRHGSHSFSSDPVRNTELGWVPHSRQPDFIKYFEE